MPIKVYLNVHIKITQLANDDDDDDDNENSSSSHAANE